MPKQINNARIEAWTLDQLAKSVFFHRKLHEWKLLETSDQIDQVRGEALNWTDLNISEVAWNTVIHRGIKPVIVFAHPVVLQTIAGSTGYYRMLAIVSQKSMKRLGYNLDGYELGKALPESEIAAAVARHFNRIISVLIEADDTIDVREFDLWRGMAAGAQAQGSWQNNKGASAEIAIREIVLRRLQERGFVDGSEADATKIELDNGRTLVFADEPDIAIYQNNLPQIAVEVKGGIDSAGVLERIGAALKSLQRARQENPNSQTILILQDVSMTDRARADLALSISIVTHLFSTTALLEDEQQREIFFRILGI
ncbi:MAG: XcyI family restriction endonuclease [Chloroflexota bacterium]|nr:XcyI family restriction endonuclease [Chloroflexota bacterium]